MDRQSSPNSRATPDGTAYTYGEANGTVTVTAAPTTGTNNREFFWGSKGSSGADTEACATFSGNEGATYDQPGIALRITNNGNQAVTVTENVWGGVRNMFNFHVWNSETPGVYALFGQVRIERATRCPGDVAAQHVRQDHGQHDAVRRVDAGDDTASVG